MRRRQTVVEKFSTLLDAKEDSEGKLITYWKLIPLLENNMRLRMESCADAGTPFWARYWLQEARSSNPDPLAKQHMYAYLQEACWWAAKKIYNQIHTQDRSHTQDISLVDCLQIARLAALDPVAIFRRYDDSRGMSLNTYGQFQIERAILEVVRKGTEAASYSDWGLLRAFSKKELKTALENAGIKEPQLSQYLLAWQCFKEIYTPTRRRRQLQLQDPNPEELAAFAELYNQLRSPQYQEPVLSGEDIDRLLKMCIQAARASTKIPQFVDFNDLEQSDEDPEYSNKDRKRSPTLDTFQEQAEQQEEQWQQIRAVLAEAIEALPKSGQTMLQLSHGLGLRQTDIGRAMSLRQYQVSRELQRYKKSVLQPLGNWSKTQMGIELSEEKINNELARMLNPWLDWYCSLSLHEFLQTTLLEELRDEIPLLKRHYGQELSQVEVASELNLSETAVNQRLLQVKQHLQARLYNWVKDTYNLTLDALNSAVKPTAALVEEWLTKANYSTFEI